MAKAFYDAWLFKTYGFWGSNSGPQELDWLSYLPSLEVGRVIYVDQAGPELEIPRASGYEYWEYRPVPPGLASTI